MKVTIICHTLIYKHTSMAEELHLPVHDCHTKRIFQAPLCKATPLFKGTKSARRIMICTQIIKSQLLQVLPQVVTVIIGLNNSERS